MSKQWARARQGINVFLVQTTKKLCKNTARTEFYAVVTGGWLLPEPSDRPPPRPPRPPPRPPAAPPRPRPAPFLAAFFDTEGGCEFSWRPSQSYESSYSIQSVLFSVETVFEQCPTYAIVVHLAVLHVRADHSRPMLARPDAIVRVHSAQHHNTVQRCSNSVNSVASSVRTVLNSQYKQRAVATLIDPRPVGTTLSCVGTVLEQ